MYVVVWVVSKTVCTLEIACDLQVSTQILQKHTSNCRECTPVSDRQSHGEILQKNFLIAVELVRRPRIPFQTPLTTEPSKSTACITQNKRNACPSRKHDRNEASHRLAFTFSSCGVSFSLHGLLPWTRYREKMKPSFAHSIREHQSRTQTERHPLFKQPNIVISHSSKFFRGSTLSFLPTFSSVCRYVHVVVVLILLAQTRFVHANVLARRFHFFFFPLTSFWHKSASACMQTFWLVGFIFFSSL